MSRVVAAPWVLSGRGGRVLRDAAIALEGDVILAVGPRAEVEARHGRGERLDAILLPALVNAHLHLEVSHLAGRVPGGAGLPKWIGGFVSTRAAIAAAEEAPAMARAAEALRAAGVAAVGDVSNTLASVPALGAAGLEGTVYHEVFGFTSERIEAALAAARAARERTVPPPGLRIAPSPHAVYSTHPATIAALLDAGPASIHLAEDPAERAFVATGDGPFAAFLSKMGQPGLRPTARSAVDAVAAHLRRHHLAVHCVDLDDADRAALARSGAAVVLCPRSNRHIGGRIADVPALVAAGVRLAVGTDSLASCASLAPVAELAVLRGAYPEVSAESLFELAWDGSAVGAPHVGTLVPGVAPGILAAPLTLALSRPDSWVRGPGGEGTRDHASLTSAVFEYLLQAHGAEERPFHWIARNRAEVA